MLLIRVPSVGLTGGSSASAGQRLDDDSGGQFGSAPRIWLCAREDRIHHAADDGVGGRLGGCLIDAVGEQAGSGRYRAAAN